MEEKFQLNHYYLVRRRRTSVIHLIKIVYVLEKTFYVQWNNGSYTWEIKKDLFDYELIEDITEQYQNIPFSDSKLPTQPYQTEIEFEICSFCGGIGQVSDNKSTAGTKLCPVCFGNGQVIKKKF